MYNLDGERVCCAECVDDANIVAESLKFVGVEIELLRE